MTLILILDRKVLLFLFLFATPFLAGAATLSLSPSSGSQNVGDIFTVNILLDTGVAQTDGVDINSLNFNPSLLEAQDEDLGAAGVQITAGSLMSTTLLNSVNNAAGRIQFSQIPGFGTQFTGSGILAAIHFLVKAPGTAAATFDFTPGSTSDTNVASAGNDILTSVTNGSYTLSAAPPPSDTVAPSAITNLTSSNVSETSAVLSWTAPGDDGSTGTASNYDIRYSTSIITETNWANVAQATGEPAPQIAGTSQSYTLVGLTASTTYFAALKTSDEAPNISALSNVISFKTNAPMPPPPPSATSSVAILSPNTSQCFSHNSQMPISWSRTNVDHNALYYTTDGGATIPAFGNWFFMFDSGSAATSYNWTVPSNVISDAARIWVEGHDSNHTTRLAIDSSNANFSIKASCPTPDTTAPGMVNNLAFSNISETSVILNWSATGDDGSTGTASSYDIRYSTTTITETNWGSRIQTSGEPMPQAVGTSQSYTLVGLIPSTVYFAAMKISDEVPNISGLSNVISFTTNAPMPPSGGGGGGAVPSISSVTLLSPNTSQCFSHQSQMPISWSRANVDHTALYYTVDGGATVPAFGLWFQMHDSGSNATSYNWTIPSTIDSDGVRIWVEGHDPNHTQRLAIDSSDVNIAIRASCAPLATGGGGGGSTYVPPVSSGGGGGGISSTDTVPPQRVQNLKIVFGIQQIKLSWTNPKTDFDWVRTVVVRKIGSAPVSVLDGVKIYEGTEEMFIDLNLEAGKEYFYALFTIDRVPNYSERVIASGAPLAAQLSIGAVVKPTTIFNQNLSLGSNNEEVKELQKLLNKLGFIVAQSGPGSSGQESTYFGSLTKQAVIKFQNQYRSEVLTPVGLTEGTGFVGNATRAKLNALVGRGGTAIASTPQTSINVPPPSTVSGSFTKNLSQGVNDPEVKNLQILLNQLGFIVSQSGPGSSGQESTYFGSLTKQAVIKFQNQYRSEVLTPVGLTEGTGFVGSLTRTKLNILNGKTVSLFKTSLNQISVVLETIDATSTRNVLTKAVAGLQAIDFRELILKKTDKKINISEFWPPLIGQLKPPLENFFENDFVAFVFVDDKGKWPGYVLKLKSSVSLTDAKNQLAQWEKTANFGNLFIKSQLIITQSFRNGLAGSIATRFQLYNQSGAALNYGWKDNLLIISTSYAGFLEALIKL